MGMMIIKIAFLMIIFVMLYIVAFVSNRHYRDSEDVLFISKSQWKAILLLILPTLITVFMK